MTDPKAKTTSFAGRLVRRLNLRLPKRLWQAGLGLFGLSIATSLAMVVAPHWRPAIHSIVGAMLYGGFAAWAGAAAFRMFGERTTEAADVCIQGDKLLLRDGGRETELPLSTLVDGFVVPALPSFGQRADQLQAQTATRPEVVLRTKTGRQWRISMNTVEEAWEFLAMTGLQAEKRKIRVKRRKSGTVILSQLLSVLALPLPVAAVVLVLGGVKQAAGIALFPIVWGLIWWRILRALQPSDLEIGADGIAWKRRWRRHYIPYRDIRSVQVVGDSILIETDSAKHEIALGPIPFSDRRMAATRIRYLMRQSRGELPQLGRQGREYGQWVEGLKRALSESFRQAHIPKVRVEATLNDPQAPEDQRLGAAIALFQSDPEAARRLAREAAEGCANEDLAAALQAFADDELDAATAERVGQQVESL